jgi:hypothetical protein
LPGETVTTDRSRVKDADKRRMPVSAILLIHGLHGHWRNFPKYPEQFAYNINVCASGIKCPIPRIVHLIAN